MDDIGWVLGSDQGAHTAAQERWDKKTYKRKPGGGRKPPDKRKIAEGIFYVLRTGCQWKAVPTEYGKGSNIHRYLQEWTNAGFFETIWALGLERYDELEGLGWEWQSLDGCMTKAPLARESVGRNPTDRGKNGYKTKLTGWRAWLTHSHCGIIGQYPRCKTTRRNTWQDRHWTKRGNVRKASTSVFGWRL